MSSALNVFSLCRVWNQVHQQPPHTPLCRSASAAKASQVSGPSGWRVYSFTAGWTLVIGERLSAPTRGSRRERSGYAGIIAPRDEAANAMTIVRGEGAKITEPRVGLARDCPATRTRHDDHREGVGTLRDGSVSRVAAR